MGIVWSKPEIPIIKDRNTHNFQTKKRVIALTLQIKSFLDNHRIF